MSECKKYWKKRKCPVCGKDFYPAPYHVYKDARKRYDPPLVCSYPCAEETKRIVGLKGEKRGTGNCPEIDKFRWTPQFDAIAGDMKAAGKSYQEIADVIGCRPISVRSRFEYLRYKEKRKKRILRFYNCVNVNIYYKTISSPPSTTICLPDISRYTGIQVGLKMRFKSTENCKLSKALT